MKHRSTGIFIIVLAALVAAPSASQQLVALKDSVAGRLEATLWDAFLSLNGHHAESNAAPSAPIQQAGPPASEIAARDKRTNEATPKTREASRPETQRASGREDADAHERFIAKFEHDESLLVISPEAEGALRFAVPSGLPFNLDQLMKSADKGAHADLLAARVRAIEAGGRKIKVFPALPEAGVKREQAAKHAPRARAAKDAAKRLPADRFQRNEWERPSVNFEFDTNEAEKAAPRHGGESQSRN